MTEKIQNQQAPERAVTSELEQTRPMGPLEEGDQMVIDAIDRLDEGTHESTRAHSSRNNWAKVEKGQEPSEPGGVSVNAELHEQSFFHRNQPYEAAEVKVDADEIRATVRDGEMIGVGFRSTQATAIAAGNEAKIGGSYREPFIEDRKVAQNVKKEVARRINAAADELERSGSGKVEKPYH